MTEEENAEMTVDSVGLEESATSEENEETEPIKNEPVLEAESEKTEDEPEEETKEVEPEGEVEEEPDKGKKNGVQKRINEITLKRREAEQRTRELEAKVQELEGREQAVPVQQQSPNIDDYEDYEKYETALIDFKVAEQLGKERQTEAVKRQQDKGLELQNTFNERVAKANLEDYDGAFNSLVKSNTLPQSLVDVLIEHEQGPVLVHFLGNHLDVSDSLNKMSHNQALLKLGEISANLSNVKKTKQITKASDPINAIKSSGTKSKDFDDMDVGEIAAMLRKKRA